MTDTPTPTRDDPALIAELGDALTGALGVPYEKWHTRDPHDLAVTIARIVEARERARLTQYGCAAIDAHVRRTLPFPVVADCIAHKVLLALFDATLLSTGTPPAGG